MLVNFIGDKIIPLAKLKSYAEISNVIKELESSGYAFSSLSRYIPTKINWVHFQQPSFIIGSYNELDYSGLAPLNTYYTQCMNSRNNLVISKAYTSPIFPDTWMFHVGKGFFDKNKRYLGQVDLVFPLSTLQQEIVSNLGTNNVISFAIVNDLGEIIISDLSVPLSTNVSKFFYSSVIQGLNYKIVIDIKWVNFLSNLINTTWVITAILMIFSLCLEYGIKKYNQVLLTPLYFKFKRLKAVNSSLLNQNKVVQISMQILADYSGELSNRLFNKANEIVQRSNILLNFLKQASEINITIPQQVSLLAYINNAAIDINSLNVVLDTDQQVNIGILLNDVVNLNLPQAIKKNVVINVDNKIDVIVSIDKISLLQLLASITGQIVLELPPNSKIDISAYVDYFHYLIEKKYQEDFFSFKLIGWQAILNLATKLNGVMEIKHMLRQGNELVLTISY
jgi:hypothetical protein